MCYNVKALLRSQLKRAKRHADEQAIQEIQLQLFELGVTDLFQVSGFAHPKMLIYTDAQSLPEVATWGLVPHWVKDEQGKIQLWNSTLNARGETIFEKASFRDAAKSKRCLIYLDGFYEHHHLGGKTFPFFISRKDGEPFAVAGLWAEWTDRQNKSKLITFSIVTTRANQLIARIHNNPKLEGPRMPVILPEELTDHWLNPALSQNEATELLLPFDEDFLTAHTVARIAGKESKGNVPEASEEVEYPELKIG
ncbi:MAG: SOS response-associated peptidase [Prolixibacteraceae bacterium]|nr:SOS response-associated peptidase [Prolixibacteraceae bacterium]